MKKSYIFLYICTLLVNSTFSQGKFFGIDYQYAKAYRVNAGYEAPKPENGVLMTKWLSGRLVTILTQAETFEVGQTQTCGYSDKIVFFNAEGKEVIALSLGMDCGRFSIVTQAANRNTATDLSEAGMSSVYEVLEDTYLNLSPVLPKNAKKGHYVVVAGDTWASIAEDFDTSIELLCAMNGKKSFMSVKPGIKLNYYAGVKYYAYPSSKGPTTSPAPPVNQTKKTHIVVAKETLFSIAKKYGMTVATLQKANNLTGNNLKIGQVLIVN